MGPDVNKDEKAIDNDNENNTFSIPESQMISDELNLPTPSEHVVENNMPLDVSQYPGFDPEKHEVDENGIPVKTPTGRYKKKSKNGNGGDGSFSENTGSGSERDEAFYAAVRDNAFIVGMACAIFDPEEWKPDKGENTFLEESLAAYYRTVGTPNLPPWMGVVMAYGSYAARRVGKEKTKEKMGILKEKFSNIKKFFKVKKVLAEK